MEEDPQNGKESSHTAHANGTNECVMHFFPTACPLSVINTETFSDTAVSLLKHLTYYSCNKSP